MVGGGEFLDESLLDKGGQCPLEGLPGRDRPDGGSLSFDRDLLGGILAWLLGHQGVGGWDRDGSEDRCDGRGVDRSRQEVKIYR